MDRRLRPNLIIFPIVFFSIDESNEMDIMFDTFSDVSDSYLLKQGKALISNSKKYVFIRRYVSVNHLRAKKDNIMF